MKYSTNALAARYFAMQGRRCETVQSWRGRQRHDLFGIGDTMALIPPNVLIVQNCSYGTLKAHRDAIDALPERKTLQDCGVILELWEWRRKKLKRGGKNKGREWYLRRQQAFGRLWTEPSEWFGPYDLYPKT